ncbi:MAG TPA: hypothetical protein VEX86_19710 [Longimicrobium sp.]|nr:hypothetical protein [Longimicrobium sp.]
MNEQAWPFDQGPNVAAITTRGVVFSGAPVLLVAHYSDDDGWGFMDGRLVTMADMAVVSMAEAVQRDATLREIADLPPGWTATRPRVGAPWVRSPDESI